jgi:hypothetical protein
VDRGGVLLGGGIFGRREGKKLADVAIKNRTKPR